MSPKAPLTQSVENLLNPAYCALLIEAATREHAKETGRSMPFALAFLILPLCLPSSFRDALPKSKSTVFHAWLNANGHLRAELPAFTTAYAPYTRKALRYGLQCGALKLEEDALRTRPKTPTLNASTDTAEALAKATFLGRWLGTAGTTQSVFMMGGIRP